jgi:hypothetical protein
MSRQLVFSSAIAVMVMTAFALSATVKAQDVVRHSPLTDVRAESGR